METARAFMRSPDFAERKRMRRDAGTYNIALAPAYASQANPNERALLET